MNATIICTNCGERFPDELMGLGGRDPCPVCGSCFKTINLCVVEEAGLELHDCITGKMKDKNFNAKKNPRYEFFEGDDLRQSDGTWMHKSRVIDKRNNKYLEKIIDPKTGEVVHSCEEPLSDHFGHGSAKFKTDINA